jgi:hypothetical protein
LTGGFKGVRRREWSKNKIKIFNKKKTLPLCLLFQGHVTGTAPFFFRSKEAYCANYGTPMISLSVKIHRLQKEDY